MSIWNIKSLWGSSFLAGELVRHFLHKPGYYSVVTLIPITWITLGSLLLRSSLTTQESELRSVSSSILKRHSCKRCRACPRRTMRSTPSWMMRSLFGYLGSRFRVTFAYAGVTPGLHQGYTRLRRDYTAHRHTVFCCSNVHCQNNPLSGTCLVCHRKCMGRLYRFWNR